MIFGNEIPLEKLEDDQINLLVHLTQDFLEIIKREIQMVDFWDSYEKQKRLKGFLASHILRFSSRQSSPKEDDVVKEDHGTYGTKKQVDLFSKRNEIAQRLLELAYHIYGPKNGN
jgi:type I restriction enzyme R subunit